MDRIRVLIVDDEPPARAKVRRFLADDPEVEIVGEAGSGEEAIERIEALRPDLVFLDVQMPEPDGFGVVAALEEEALPHVVFATAFDAYAVRAFEVHAVDYLLKPFDPERFQTALDRAKRQVRRRRTEEIDDRLRRVLAEVRPRPAFLERLMVRDGARAIFLAVGEVDWVESEQNYVRLHVGPRSYLLRTTLAGLEERLDPTRFARIHRSRIVNLDRVRELHPWSHGDWMIVLRDGTELMLSRRFRDRLPPGSP